MQAEYEEMSTRVQSVKIKAGGAKGTFFMEIVTEEPVVCDISLLGRPHRLENNYSLTSLRRRF